MKKSTILRLCGGAVIVLAFYFIGVYGPNNQIAGFIGILVIVFAIVFERIVIRPTLETSKETSNKNIGLNKNGSSPKRVGGKTGR